MKVNYKHPAFAVWHLTEEPVRTIPYGALLKWFDRVTQFGFHFGGGEIAWRDGVIRAEEWKSAPDVSWHDKECVCVLAREGRPVVFGEAAGRAEFQAGRHASRQDFISACIGGDLGTFGNFPVWIFDRYGKCFLHPVAPEAVFEESPDVKNEGKNLLCHKMAGVQSYLMPQTTIVRQKQRHAANNGMQKTERNKHDGKGKEHPESGTLGAGVAGSQCHQTQFRDHGENAQMRQQGGARRDDSEQAESH